MCVLCIPHPSKTDILCRSTSRYPTTMLFSLVPHLLYSQISPMSVSASSSTLQRSSHSWQIAKIAQLQRASSAPPRITKYYILTPLVVYVSDNPDQNAAGTLGYLIDNALQPYLASLTGPPPSPDLSQPVLKSLQSLMLAQAQECYWQKAVMGVCLMFATRSRRSAHTDVRLTDTPIPDNYRNSTIARLAKQVRRCSVPLRPESLFVQFQVSRYYAASLEAILTPKPPVHKLFPAVGLPLKFNLPCSLDTLPALDPSPQNQTISF